MKRIKRLISFCIILILLVTQNDIGVAAQEFVLVNQTEDIQHYLSSTGDVSDDNVQPVEKQPEAEETEEEKPDTEDVSDDNEVAISATQETPTSGQCGDDAYWKFEDGVLTISGKGAMWDVEGKAHIAENEDGFWGTFTLMDDTSPWRNYENKISSIVVEEGITRIGAYVFYQMACSEDNPCVIVLPTTLQEIGEAAFQGNRAVSGNLILPSNLKKIERGAFANCTKLTGDLIIPDSVVEIGEAAFVKCEGLTGQLHLPASITEIADYAFQSCGLTGELSIPKNVKRIGAYAFGYCSFDGSLTIPGNVVTVGNGAFTCNKFDKKLTLEDGIKRIEKNAFYRCEVTESLKLPDTLEYIGEGAFQASSFPGGLTIPASVREIGQYAFKDCSFTGDLIIMDGVEKIGNQAFACLGGTDTKSFSKGKLTLPKTLRVIEANTFWNCGFTGDLIIPQGVEKIEDGAFRDCNFNGNLVLPEGLITIGDKAFYGSSMFFNEDFWSEEQQQYVFPKQELALPKSLQSIGSNAIRGNFINDTYVLGENLKYIGDYAFPIAENMYIPSGVINIGKFNWYEDYTIYGEKGSYAEQYAKDNGITFSEYNFGNNVSEKPSASVESGTVKFGSKIELSVSAPNARIYYTIDGTVPTTESLLYENPITILDNDTIRTFSVEDGKVHSPVAEYKYQLENYDKNIYETGVCGAVCGYYKEPVRWGFNKQTGEFIVAGKGKMSDNYPDWNRDDIKSIRIDKGIMEIGRGAFHNCSVAEDIIIPEGVTRIGEQAFCGNFTGKLVLPSTLKVIEDSAFSARFTGTLTLPSGLEKIGDSAFFYNQFEGDLIIPDSVTEIGNGAFWSCRYLKGKLVLPEKLERIENRTFSGTGFTCRLNLPETLNYIGDDAFSSVPFTGDLIIPDSVIQIGEGAFFNCDGFNGKLVLPANLKDLGKDVFWGCENIKGDIVIPDSITRIKEFTFCGCGFDGTLILPKQLTSIEKYAFANNKKLSGTLELPDGLKRIENGAFGGCEKLTGDIVIPDSVTVIGEYAFQDCLGIENYTVTLPDGIQSIGQTSFSKTEGQSKYKNLNITILCTPGTYAEKWAKDNGFLGKLSIADIPNQVYTGKPVTPEVEVSMGNIKLVKGKDYKLTYKNNTNAAAKDSGKAPTVTITFMNDYKGRLEKTFTILPKEITEENISFVNSTPKYANKKEQKVSASVMVDGKKLTLNKDYTLSYPDKTEGAYTAAGNWNVTIQGIGNYGGMSNFRMRILDNKEVLANKLTVKKLQNMTYTEGNLAEPHPEISYKGKVLTEGIDYELSYQNNEKAGTAVMTITGLEAEGTYSIVGSTDKSFKITGTPITKAKVEYSNKFVYSGNEITPDIRVTMNKEQILLREGIDYSVRYEKNVAAGSGKIIITGEGGYTGTITKTFSIQKLSLASEAAAAQISFVEGDTCTYEKSGVKPEIEVKAGNILLVEGKDYTVSYKNNTKIAGASDVKCPTVVIKGKGNYQGSISAVFSIVEKNIQDSDIVITVPDLLCNKAGKYQSTPVLTDGAGKKLTAKKDYVILGYFVDGKEIPTKTDLTAGSTVTVKIQGKGMYCGMKEATYLVVQNNVSKINLKVAPVEYTGSEITFSGEDFQNGTIQITVPKNQPVPVYGEDFIISGYSKNVNKGTASMTIKGISSVYGGTKVIKFSIKEKVVK